MNKLQMKIRKKSWLIFVVDHECKPNEWMLMNVVNEIYFACLIRSKLFHCCFSILSLISNIYYIVEYILNLWLYRSKKKKLHLYFWYMFLLLVMETNQRFVSLKNSSLPNFCLSNELRTLFQTVIYTRFMVRSLS